MHFSKRFLRVISVLILNKFIECAFREKIINNYTESRDFIESEIKSDRIINPRVETLVEVVINNKVDELKPYLQDNDGITMDTENNLTLEGKDETTIIEFIPKNKYIKKGGLRDKSEPLKNNVNKYKKVRDKIKKALDKEIISDKTQVLVMKTLDRLIAQLIGSQCSWKSGFENDTATSLRTSHVINELWIRQWKKLRDNYINKFKPITDPREFEEIITFLDKLQTFFTLITKDVDTLSDQYKIKCVYLDKPGFRKHKNMVYDSETDLNRRNCRQFMLCSSELRNFMTDFFNFLNETAVSVIRNYAEMYLRDTDNDFDKQSIVTAINGSCNIIEKNIIETFVKQTKSLQLDENKIKEANIKALSKYVKSTIAEVRNNVKVTINDELKTVNELKATAIQTDLKVNLKVDMDNLEREVLGRICLVFKFCNGNYKGRRSGYLIDINKENDIYVKVQLKLDDEIKNSLNLTNMRRYMKQNPRNNAKQTHTSEKFDRNLYLAFNVTRTTPFLDSIIIKDD